MHNLKNLIRKLTPNFLLLAYHRVLAELAAIWYRHPSRQLYVIGITGTKGKTSTANFVWSVLNTAGIKTGLIGTANIRVGNKERMNEYHMTMPGRFVLQKLLREMANAGCTHVVMEVTSEGIKLERHQGIVFDCAIFTNLSPEHLPSHDNSFEKYKQTKGQLFASLMQHAKKLAGNYVKRLIIANSDDEHGAYYLNFPADEKITYGIKTPADFCATDIKDSPNGVDFKVGTDNFHLSVLGSFNVYNALPAIGLAKHLGLATEQIAQGLDNLKIIPGRMEKIDANQKFTVIVDYAHEKVSMNAALDAAQKMAQGNKVIVLLGAEGGGRDKSKRAAMGEAAASKADFVICSNVDPYDDSPTEIVEDIAKVAEQHGKVRQQNLFVIEDRRQGIAKALMLAQPGDVVIITGKGAEQSMIVGGKAIPWDDRQVVREELDRMLRIEYSQPKK